MRASCASACLLLFILGVPRPGAAQPRVTASATVLFYGDNTEFRNPFREGETLFGAAAWLVGGIAVSDRVTVRLGVVANRRFGGDDAFELVRPVAAFEVRGRRSRFTVGALDTIDFARPAGPEHDGPHDLLPPLQRETLAFERPHEEGLQWVFRGQRLRQEMWVNWQQVNTSAHRERFDTGAVIRLDLTSYVGLGFQGHIVHSGGQLFASGPVADSFGYGPGVIVKLPAAAPASVIFDAYGLASHHVPDRSMAARRRSGAGMFTRLAAERAGWRGHILFWRACDYIKVEGDPNYQALRLDGSRYRKVRDYSEAGIARSIRLGSQTSIEASARLHRVEGHYNYSYRVLATTRLTGSLR